MANLNKINEELNELKVQVNSKRREIEKRLITKPFFDGENLALVSWEKLNELGESVFDFPEANSIPVIARLPCDEDSICFYTVMAAGAKVPMHYHDCMEIMTVLKGKVLVKVGLDESPPVKLDQLNNSMILVSGEPHKLKALEETILIAVLNKPK